MKIIKKNQLTILVLALMLVTAGYLNYNDNIETGTEIASIGDATLVSSNLSNNIASVKKEIENNIDATSSNISISAEDETDTNEGIQKEDDEYFASSKLDRDTMYSQMLESYQKILDSTTTTEKQKESAQEEINKINKNKNAIMISENLIKTKGFENVVIFINDDCVNIVIDKSEVKKEDIAQIQSIISREVGAKIDNIHITNKGQIN